VSKYSLELFIDALKMRLEIISGSLYKVSVDLDAFGRDGGFASAGTR
jgi:hypothetical protein